MGIELKFEGLEKLNSALSRAASQLPRSKELFLRQEAELVKGRAKLNTPVDTGYLRSGWQTTGAEGDSVTLFNNTSYSAHVLRLSTAIGFLLLGVIQAGSSRVNTCCATPSTRVRIISSATQDKF